MAEDFLKLVHLNEAVGDLAAELEGRSPSTEIIDTDESLGRVAAFDITAPSDMPGFERSAMDGFAVRASDTFGAGESLPAYLEITGEILMGQPASIEIREGGAARIPTGGMMPRGADAVVMVEHTDIDGNTVEIAKAVAPGENVILKDEDVAAGAVVVSKGTAITPPLIGALTGLGIKEVEVFEMPTVGIISTGDEVIPPGETPAPGQVRDINSYLLQAAVRQAGCNTRLYGIIKDDFDSLVAAAGEALDMCDCLLISGGSSMGARDITADVLGKLGKPGLLAHGLYLKPGKPTLIGCCGKTPVFGLPGNPGSALAVLSELVLPVLSILKGESRGDLPRGARSIEATLKASISSATGRMELVPVSLKRENGTMTATPIFGKSNLIGTLAKAQGYIRIPEGMEGMEAGSTVKIELVE